MDTAMQRDFVRTHYSKWLRVYIQGDLSDRAGKVVFVTVHDVGGNHRAFSPFVDSVEMSTVRSKSIWIHVVLPGQDDGEDALPEEYQFPTLDQFAHDLVHVLDKYELRTVLAFGEGAGANILTRFGLYYPNRVLGLIMLDCTSFTAGFDEQIKHRVCNLLEGGVKYADKLMRYMTYHKAGIRSTEHWKENRDPGNLCKYLDAYLKRTDITRSLYKHLKMETLVVVGQHSPYLHATKKMVDNMDKLHTTLLVMDDIADVLFLAPKKMTRALILFAKGCGVLLGVPMVGLEKEYQQLKERREANAAQIALAEAVIRAEKVEDHVLQLYDID